jgi:putative colanic acid biosynthesis UDP-glucose lipid carrier transferase
MPKTTDMEPAHLSRNGAARYRGALRVGTSETPATALLRHCIFPASAVVGLIVSALIFGQPFTRPYFIVAVLAFVLSWRLLGAAECNELRPSSQIEFFIPRVLLGWTKVVGILLFIGFIAKSSANYSRTVIITWFALTPLLFIAARAVAYRLLCRWSRQGSIARTHVIVGSNALATDFASRLERDPSLGTLIGFFRVDNDGYEELHGDSLLPPNMLGRVEDLPAYVRRNAIDVIHIAVPLDSSPGLREVLKQLHDSTASIYFLLDLPQDDHSEPRIVEMADTPMLAYRETPYRGLPGAAKRFIDVSVAGIALLVLWPVLLLIAIIVRLDSPGPVIFKQRRYGLNGEEIAVYKFRTMTVCEDGDSVRQAQRGDARVTRIGAFLRRTSLDELPQLLCVIAGSMSLVGPRPHAVAHNEQYRRIIDGYMLRHKVQPGMTGWAQINGFRGATDTLEQMQQRVAYDLDYLRRWSPWVDIQILWRTVWLVIRDRNAY